MVDMKRRTIQMFGSAMVLTMAGEALPHLATPERCVGTAEEVMLCGPSERILERRLDHAPEGEFEAFGGWLGTWIASGQVSSSTAASTPTYRYVPAGEIIFGRIR